MHEFIGVTYLLLPLLAGAILNGICAKYNWLPWLYKPMDFGLSFMGKPLFGANKTFRGLLAVSIGCCMFYLLQSELLHQIPAFQRMELMDYQTKQPWLVGFLLGVGSILGELPNSFLKRRLGIKPGEATSRNIRVLFFVLDQIDLLLGFWIVLSFYMPVTFLRVLYSIIIVFFIHILITSIGYKLGMRKSKR